MGWLGLDDTDSLKEGCTTYSFHLLLESLPSSVTVLSPRLVRLWPFAQQRTRGNAAVAVELLVEDESELLHYLEGFWNDHLLSAKGKMSPSEHDDREQYPADPGMVWFSSEQPNEEFYTMAVQSEVHLNQVPTANRSWGGQGRIGATAAVAWRQKQCTWEAIAWREPIRHGLLERTVCEQTLSRVDSMPSTFLSRDPRKGTGLVAPRGPCPVLFGVRARDSTSALEAGNKLLAAESTESTIGMRVFTTNQATDDHLSHSQKATVTHVEILSRGNCVITTESDTWLAFAESGSLKILAQWLHPGDVIEGYGLSPEFGVVHLEKLRVLSAYPDQQRPMCDECSVRMKSMGKNQGCRCPKCKQRTEDTWDAIARIPPFESWVQPPVDARRHLARPLEWEDSTDSSSFMGNQ